MGVASIVYIVHRVHRVCMDQFQDMPFWPITTATSPASANLRSEISGKYVGICPVVQETKLGSGYFRSTGALKPGVVDKITMAMEQTGAS